MPSKTTEKPAAATEEKYPNASLRLTEAAARELGGLRAPGENWAGVTRRLLDSALTVLQTARQKELAGLFTVSEWNLIYAALDGVFIEPSIMWYLPAEIAESDADTAHLNERLRGLSAAGRWALADAIERARLHRRAGGTLDAAFLAGMGIAASEGI